MLFELLYNKLQDGWLAVGLANLLIGQLASIRLSKRMDVRVERLVVAGWMNGWIDGWIDG